MRATGIPFVPFARTLVIGVAGLVALVVPTLPAGAHGGIVPQPVVQDLPAGLPALEAEGLVAYSPRIRVTNDGPELLTVVDESGRPWLRISEAGVFADLSARQWSESLDSSGRGVDPDPATPSAWTQVSVLPTWEWFDTELLARSEEEAHEWAIPVVVDGALDEIRGVLQESDLEGRWVTELLGDGRIGDARVTAVSGAVPVFVVQRLDAEEIVVLGRYDEPMLRLTGAGFEVNRASPTWNDHARLDPDSPVGDVVEDPDAEPVWELRLAGAPTATWLDLRADSGQVTPRTRDATELTTTLPIVVDGERHEVEVRTSWVGDPVPLVRMTVPTLVAVSLGAGLLAAGAVRLWERRRDGGAGDDGPGASSAPDDDPAGGRAAATREA